MVLATGAYYLPFGALKYFLLILAFPVGFLCIAFSPPAQIILRPAKSFDRSYKRLEILSEGNSISGKNEPSEPIVADIVAVHGLGALPKTTWGWRQRAHQIMPACPPAANERSKLNKPGPNWLRDFLPTEDLNARIMTFNHNTAWGPNALTKSLEDYGQDLLRALDEVRSTKEEKSRPIIFIGHSYGGIIIKQALEIAGARRDGDFRCNIHEQAKGFIFLGTPHKGTQLTVVGKMISLLSYWIGSNTDLLEAIQPKSVLNEKIHANFMSLHRKKDMVCIFEAVRESFWGIPLMHVVEKDSAVIPGSEVIGFEESHRKLQRFPSREDHNYKALLFWIRNMLAKTTQAEGQSPQAQSFTLEEQACLQSLFFREMGQRRCDITPASSNTCDWLLGKEHFTTWLSQDHGLLWIKGKPGAGKSTLMEYALRNFEERRPNGGFVVASFFFHGRGAPMQRNALGMFRSILHQILTQNRSLLPKFESVFASKREAQGRDWDWDQRDLQDFFGSEVVGTSNEYPIRIFLDALDECGEEVARELVSYFRRLTSQMPPTRPALSICFSCRHYPIMDIGKGLEICVEDENRRDISTYVKAGLGAVIAEQGSGALALEEAIIGKASGIFQWVAIAVSLTQKLHMNGETLKTIERELSELPPDLHELYGKILGEIGGKNLPRTLCLMQWICFARRPLSLTELRFAMVAHLSSDHQLRASEYYAETDKQMERQVTALSGGLAEVKHHGRKRRVQFIHQSVNDYLIDAGLRNLDDSKGSTVGRGHHQLSRYCINYSTMEEVSLSKSQMDRDGMERQFPLLKYAATSWVWHAEKAESENISQSDLSARFEWPSSHILQRWIGALGMVEPWSIRYLNQQTLLHVTSRSGLLSAIQELLEHDGIEADPKDNYGQTPLSLAAGSGRDAIVKLLIGRDDVVADSRDNDGQTPLSLAAERGLEATVKLLVDRDDVAADSKNNDGQTPLLFAAMKGHEAVVTLLVDREDVAADSKDNNGQTPLSWAAVMGHKAVVKLLADREDVAAGSRDNYGQTPLLLAAVAGHEATVKLLVDRDDVVADSKDNEGFTPLMWAAKRGHNSVVGLLVNRDDVVADSRNSNGRTPLMWAARGGHETVVKLLADRSDVAADSKDNDGRTPLAWAAMRGHEAVVKLLLRRGDIAVDSKDNGGRTPLLWAAIRGHAAVVKLLADRDDVVADSKDNSGWTPLSWAAERGHETVVKLLVKRNDVAADSKDNSGRTPLSWAAEWGLEEVAKMFVDRSDVVTDSKDNGGRTPLSWASARGCEAIAGLLVGRGDVAADSKDYNGRTPLSWAAGSGHEAVVKLLLSRDEVIANSRENDGRTPLSWAAGSGCEAVVKLLVSRDDIAADSKDGDGQTPLSWAAGSGHEIVVRLLVDRCDVIADSRENQGQTPLSLASMQGHETVVKLLADRKDVAADSRDNSGQTPLSWAAMQGHREVVKFLADREDVAADSRDNRGRTPLSWAAMQGHKAVVKLLADRDDVTAASVDNGGQTPLSWASKYRHEAVVKLLDNRG
ncbi:MAG: hypothetical protein M1813_009839 [Trichoglossum hirsutum]|nr:MAG: hypothetical protein M1813_009839 [Trichoglossum hirsutum]